MGLGVAIKEVKDYIRQNCIEHGKFTLRSGAKSDIYVDCKKLLLSKHLSLITYQVVKLLRDKNVEFNAIGGPAEGIVPLIGSFVHYVTYNKVHGLADRGFVVRKVEKTYGKGDIVIGCIENGDSCVVVEDTATTGHSLCRAVEEVEKLNCKVVHAVTIIDREMGAKELFDKRNIPFSVLYTLNDLMKE